MFIPSKNPLVIELTKSCKDRSCPLSEIKAINSEMYRDESEGLFIPMCSIKSIKVYRK